MGSHTMSVLRNPRVADGCTNVSTFKNDYQHCGLASKADRIEPPLPSQIQHRENGLDMSSSISVARTAFPEPCSSARHVIDKSDFAGLAVKMTSYQATLTGM